MRGLLNQVSFETSPGSPGLFSFLSAGAKAPVWSCRRDAALKGRSSTLGPEAAFSLRNLRAVIPLCDMEGRYSNLYLKGGNSSTPGPAGIALLDLCSAFPLEAIVAFAIERHGFDYFQECRTSVG